MGTLNTFSFSSGTMKEEKRGGPILGSMCRRARATSCTRAMVRGCERTKNDCVGIKIKRIFEKSRVENFLRVEVVQVALLTTQSHWVGQQDTIKLHPANAHSSPVPLVAVSLPIPFAVAVAVAVLVSVPPLTVTIPVTVAISIAVSVAVTITVAIRISLALTVAFSLAPWQMRGTLGYRTLPRFLPLSFFLKLPCTLFGDRRSRGTQTPPFQVKNMSPHSQTKSSRLPSANCPPSLNVDADTAPIDFHSVAPFVGG